MYDTVAMTTTAHWSSAEEAIDRLLPRGGESSNRSLLIEELSNYARTVVKAGRCAVEGPPQVTEISRTLSWLERPVFVCGHHRSGTTLLQQLLDGHPQIMVLPSEGSYFSSFGYVAQANPGNSDIDRFIAEWIMRLIDPNQEPHFKLGRSSADRNPYVLLTRHFLAWNAALRNKIPALASFAPLLALVAAYADVSGSPVKPTLWVEKTPLNEHYAPRLATFANARFIHVVREPAATLASLAENYRKAGIPGFKAARHALAISRSLQEASKNAARLRARYLILRYEDLTRETAREMRKVCTFLGISPDPVLLRPSVGGCVVRSNSSFDRGDAGVVQAPRAALSLSALDRRLVHTLAGSAARVLGYDVPRPGLMIRSGIHLCQVPRRALRLFRAW